MITKFSSLFAGHVDLGDMGTAATPANERRYSDAHLATIFDKTEALRRAVREGVDLIVLEKFGEQEQKGQGLNDEIFAAIAEDIPLLIAVPEFALDLWQERSGELGDTLPYDIAAFHQWWTSIQP
ncbi:MAG: DUF2478 domain-containing protein [Alphaproteobacteria bacterium]|nr:DUF2478 domain-containing protein [Alphaproteobacteria bacterium]